MKKLRFGIFGLVLGFVGIISFCSSDYIEKSYCSSEICPGSSRCRYVQINVPVGATSVDILTSTGAVTVNTNGVCGGSAIGTFPFSVSIDDYSECIFNTLQGCYTVRFNGVSSSSCNPQYTSEECQSEYDLVSSSDLTTCQSLLSGCQSDYNSCQSNTSGFNDLLNNCSNNLNACNISLSSCLSNNCPVSSGGINWSTLYINDIQHLGAGLINLIIPEEFDWDYLYTGNGEVLDIDVKGYNVDTEYIDGIITTQKTLPNKEDFNNTISGLLPGFFPGLVIILFLYFIFRFLKKIF